ncbi:MAG: hypothetical protein ACLUI3_02695 [Christensenellales bacterium]
MVVYAGVGDDALAVFRREGALAVISTDGRMKVELSGVDAGAGVALNDKLASLARISRRRHGCLI